MPPRPSKRKSSTSRKGKHSDAARGDRLHKVLADLGVASRRACEQMILEGRVAVNGEPVTTLPAWADAENDRITVDGKPVRRPRNAHRKLTIMLNKPRGIITTTSDDLNRKTVLDVVGFPAELGRIYPIGRLDADSAGLLLLTNDGELANQLTHPSFGVTKQYRVSIKGRLEQTDIDRLERGLVLAHRDKVRRATMTHVKMLAHERDVQRGDRTRLIITLREGQNREIRRMLARLGFKVRRLERISIGPLRLKGLARGEWRVLSAPELRALRNAAKPDK